MALKKQQAIENLALRKNDLYRDFWIGHDAAQYIDERIEHAFHLPPSERPENIAVIGETNSGKTLLLKRFAKKHNPPPDPNAEKTELPVLKLQMRPGPDEGRLYNAMLYALHASHAERESLDSKLRRIIDILFELDTRMVMLDEFQHAVAGTGYQQRRFLNGLKYLSNELQIPIVVAGTQEIMGALQADRQIAGRFDCLTLPNWRLDDDFFSLLKTIEPRLGLRRPSNLHQLAMAKRIHRETDGILGEVFRLLRRLALDAMKSGTERITAEDLAAENLDRIRWQRPGLRGRRGGI